MRITVEKKAKKLVQIKIKSESISFDCSIEFRAFMQAAIEQCQSPCFIIDMTDVNFIDSSGIAILMYSNKLCNEKETEMYLLNIPPSLEELLKISNLNSFRIIDKNQYEEMFES